MWLYEWARGQGLHPVITSTYRSMAEQQRLYQRWQAGLSPIPAAPPGRSKHQYGFAFDMVTDDPAAAGQQWRRMGGVYLDYDPVHFEAPA